ncbi:NAD(P)-dependent oxidoreductase [Psychrosphaera haliotis]|uniref:NAD-binding protein n=1 Tax=Psychrosphaera haliotis TaxID=555083 RepID=A0A6N8F7V3_9GAMM|nr:NAD(P)-dependent oxidoreductase [Psychrosphaera haliotis]MUH71147.1 NAD-binding protein [Psychrosphaera haliotis]
MKVSFIGLGVMGFPMAGHLAQAGLDVTVFNRTESKSITWTEAYKGCYKKTPKLAVEHSDIVFICVGNDDDLKQVMLGKDGILAGAKTNAVIVDHTTTSADIARALSAICAEQQISFLDAPVSGGQAGAENGQLTVMMGGKESDFNRVEPVIKHFSKFVKLMGEVGSGQLTKMVNQICIAGVVQGVAEGLHFARSAGLNGVDVVEVISKGAAGSWQMDNRHNTMWQGQYDFGFAVDWMRKDLGIALDEAKKNKSTLPLTSLVDQFYADVQNMGGNRWDTSSLMARLEVHRK